MRFEPALEKIAQRAVPSPLVATTQPVRLRSPPVNAVGSPCQEGPKGLRFDSANLPIPLVTGGLAVVLSDASGAGECWPDYR
ncbi:hypothetical protein FBZ91_107257 [Nitrospirillum viridazoti]|nr:hypothetical protein FBZ91_107257 [Nitrospirillum amazonense]